MKENIKNAMVDFLRNEYTKSEALQQLSTATIEEKELVVVKYKNGARDIVEIKGDVVVKQYS